MNIINAVLAAIMLVIVTMTVRDWIRVLKKARDEWRKQRERTKFHK